jgi:hypothetical protein
VILLGHQTYLATKVKGENSMFGKAKGRETAYLSDRLDPNGMVNATLRESQHPFCKTCSLVTAVYDHDFANPIFKSRIGINRDNVHIVTPDTLWEVRATYSSLKGAKRTPNPFYYVSYARNAGLPKSREAHGNGVSVVLSGRESRLHGEGRLYCPSRNRNLPS